MIKIWFSSLSSNFINCSNQEKKWSIQLKGKRAEQYLFTRSFVREVLSEFFKKPPEEIPISAAPNKKPKLASKWGFLSLSHTKDKALVGWSDKEIGIDIEHNGRTFNENGIIKRYSKTDQLELKKLSKKDLRLEVLKHWVIKESAIKLFNQSIYKSLSDWVYVENNSTLINPKLNLNSNVFFTTYKDYAIGISSKYLENSIIICDNDSIFY